MSSANLAMQNAEGGRHRPPRAAYVHVPFCRHRCGYCNFTLVAGRDDLVPQYLEALAIELSWLQTPRPVDTLYLGGGTPSHLAGPQLAQLLELCGRWFPVAADGEFTVEVNPIDLDHSCCEILGRAGVNRVSLGVQSFHGPKLQQLERDHRAETVHGAFDCARRHFRSVSLDLIFAAPQETLAEWLDDCRSALQLRPDHLSTYGLTWEQGTSFWSRRRRGELQAVDEELERAMYLAAIDQITSAGFEHYEVSSFAQPGHRSRHNQVYWSGEAYYAAGPGAARYLDGVREVNHRSTTTYLKRVLQRQSPVAVSERLSPADAARELLVLGLRRLEGVRFDQFQSRTGYDARQLLGPHLDQFAERGWWQFDSQRLRLTREGLLISDGICAVVLRSGGSGGGTKEGRRTKGE